MGQYHQSFAIPFVNKVGFDPSLPILTMDHYALGAGAKLCEQFHTWVSDETGLTAPSMYAMAWAQILTPSINQNDTFYRFITVGDYTEEADVPQGWDLPILPYELYGYDGDALEVRNCAAEVQAKMAEAFGVTFDQSTMRWADITLGDIDKCLAKISNARKMTTEHLVLAAAPAMEYLSPLYFRSTDDPFIAAHLGAVWPTALALTAISDGRGGGDFNFDPPGRWAYNHLTWIPPHRADDFGYTDITNDVLLNTEVRYLTSGR